MRILRINYSGLCLFNDDMQFDFFAEQRVSSNNNEMLFNIYNCAYSNNVIAIAGINASGKTSLLRIISFVMKYLNGDSINDIEYSSYILSDCHKNFFEIYFYDDDKGFCKLSSTINSKLDDSSAVRYFIEEERLYVKEKTKILTKEKMFEFNDKPFLIRNSNETFLKNDVSIVIAINKINKINCVDMIKLTNANSLNYTKDFPLPLISFLDPSVESITSNNEGKSLILKFKDDDKEIILSDARQLENFLSSGTIKGLNVFIRALNILKSGGYLLIDEIENHFNAEIVKTLIRFFANKEINKKGATLIYTTHYVELLDEIDRNDNIYITKKNKKLYIEKLSHILKRNDINRCDAFKSDLLGGTTPNYDAYIDLKKYLINNSK